MTRMVPFHVKICGVRLKADIDAVATAGADAVGINFYPPSIRFTDPAEAATRELAQYAGNAGLIRVGVFVSEPPESIASIAGALSLEFVQLHGDESPETASKLTAMKLRVIRAIKLPRGPLSVAQIDRAIEPWQGKVASLLLDADGGAAHGGSGQCLDWAGIHAWHVSKTSGENAGLTVPWTLAGGLDPENVASAIAASGAVSVDVASGSESPKGTKSPAKISTFTSAAVSAMSLSH